jgi:hypothetical protein
MSRWWSWWYCLKREPRGAASGMLAATHSTRFQAGRLNTRKWEISWWAAIRLPARKGLSR